MSSKLASGFDFASANDVAAAAWCNGNATACTLDQLPLYNVPQLTPGFLVVKLMQGSSCSHLGATLLPNSLDHDSFASIGSNTLSEDSGSLPRRGTVGDDFSVSVACGVFDSLCALTGAFPDTAGFFVVDGVELAATSSALPS